MSKKKISIPFIPDFENKPIEEINIDLSTLGEKTRIECLNWKKQYPYLPISNVYIARNSTTLFIKYRVTGSMLKAIYSNDLDPVWKDSCVAFYCQLPESDTYMNFEFNCIGVCLASTRTVHDESVVYRTAEELQQIIRYTTLNRRAFCEIEGLFTWEITVGIPFDLLGISDKKLPPKLLGNFYKCANDTNLIHFASWSPIHTPTPDFQRPEYFGELLFQ